MKRPARDSLRFAVLGTFLLAVIIVLYAGAWEYATRDYLKGFSDAIVPYGATPTEKVQAILAWMRNSPARGPGDEPARHFSFSGRNPEKALNTDQLLLDCGTATNAFENLAGVSGVPARRLLLLGPDDTAKHIVTEVFLGGRWVVVDPFYHVLFSGADGRPLTRAELADPAIFQTATGQIPGYDPNFSYERTAHVRLAALPLVGRPLQTALDRHFPGWRDSLDISLLLDRSSTALLAFGIFLLLPSLLGLFWLRPHGEKAEGTGVSLQQLSFPYLPRLFPREVELRTGASRLGAFFRRERKHPRVVGETPAGAGPRQPTRPDSIDAGNR